ncbi:MAG: right-handed parallel beta-helix repeat-containing protein [Dehalococcoidales bacterium]|nr:right-handed parallel beta-helix repeat-containing protein [Dehalococcoidales bacterium]
MRNLGYVFLVCLVFWALVIFGCCKAFAAARPNPPMTYYMATAAQGGSDNNAGTLAAPFETPAATNRMTLWPGDSVLKKCDGIFGSCQRDTTDIVSSSGVADSAIVYGAYGTGAMPVTTAARHITGWDSVGVNRYRKVKAAPDSVFDVLVRNVRGTRVMTQAALDANLEWRNTADTLLVYLTTPADTAFIDRSKTTAFTLTAKSYITINGIRFTHGSGVAAGANCSVALISGTNATISNCQIDSSATFGIYQGCTPGTIKNTIFLNNPTFQVYSVGDSTRIYNCDLIGGTHGVQQVGTSCVYKNNIIKDSTSKLFFVTPASKTFTSSNNLFYATSYTNKWMRGSTNFSTFASWADSTLQESGSMVADPRFVNASAGDYRLKAGSPATRLGVNLWNSGVRSDFNGKPYPNNTQRKISAGAYYRKTYTGMGEIGNEIQAEIISEMRNW